MKNFLSLTVLILIGLFTMLSCIKDAPDPTYLIPDDIAGNWSFKSLELNGTVYSECDSALNENYNTVAINFANVNAVNQTMDVTCICPDNNTETGLDFSLESNVIDLYFWKFEILNAETFNGTALELKMVYCKNSDAPINGIYTLNKQ